MAIRNYLGGLRNGTRSLLLVLGLIILALIVRARTAQHLSPTWSIYGIPGYALTRAQTAQLRQVAPFVGVPPRLGGLRYRGALVHPESGRQIAFVELLYGTPEGQFLDLSEAQTPLGVGQLGRAQRIGTRTVRRGLLQLHGVTRRFATWGGQGRYAVLVGPTTGDAFPLALAELAAGP